MKLNDLKQKIDNTIPSLKSGRDRLVKNLAAIAETQHSLQQQIDHQEQLDRDLSVLEIASPVDLQRRGLTPVQATKNADALKEQLAPVREEVVALQVKSQELKTSVHDDSISLPRLLSGFLHDSERYLRGQVASTLQSWIDRQQHDVLHDLERGRFDNLIPATSAARIVRERIRRTGRIEVAPDPITELLSILDDVLNEPIPELARHESNVHINERGFLTGPAER